MLAADGNCCDDDWILLDYRSVKWISFSNDCPSRFGIADLLLVLGVLSARHGELRLKVKFSIISVNVHKSKKISIYLALYGLSNSVIVKFMYRPESLEFLQ